MVCWGSSLHAVIRGITTGGKRGTIPRVPNYCGGARKVLTMPQVLQCSTFAFERPQVRTRGRQTCFLPRAPSNFVTPLEVLQYCSACPCMKLAIIHWVNRARSMHFCHKAASCLLTYTSIAVCTLHYGSVRRLVPSRNSSTHLYVAKLRCKQTADSRTALAIALKLFLRFHLEGLQNLESVLSFSYYIPIFTAAFPFEAVIRH